MLSINEVQERMRYAEELHSKAVGDLKNIKKLLTQRYEVSKQVKALGLAMYKSPSPLTLIQKALTLLTQRAITTLEVVPTKGTDEEDAACTKCEKFLQGVMERAREGRRIDPYLEWLLWFLIYGKSALELRFFSQYVDNPRIFPLRVLVPDPSTVFEVPGDYGILWYAKKYKLRKLDLDMELAGMKGKYALPPKVAVAPAQTWLRVEEYWDKDVKALFVESKNLYLNEHKYSTIPISLVYHSPLPFEEPEFWGRGLVKPITSALKQRVALITKLLGGVSLCFWPTMAALSGDGKLQIIQAIPNQEYDVGPGAKVIQVNIAPNTPLVEQLDSHLKEDINLSTGLTPLAFGARPPAGASGFLVSQVLGQVADVYNAKLKDISDAWGLHLQQILDITRATLGPEWGDVSEGRGYTMRVEAEKGQRKRAELTITAKDLEIRRQVKMDIVAHLADDKLLKARVITALRRPGPDGRPLLSDDTLREYYGVERPDEERKKIEAQFYRRAANEVMKVLKQEYLEKFYKEHKIDKEHPMLNEEQVMELMQHVARMASGGPVQPPYAQVPPGGAPVSYAQPGMMPGGEPQLGGMMGGGQPPPNQMPPGTMPLALPGIPQVRGE